MNIQQAITIDGQKLKNKLDINPTAHAIIESHANRTRSSRNSDLGRSKFLLLREGFQINDEDYLNYYKMMEEEGYGAIIYGRNGNRDRFEWFYNLKIIGKAILNGTTEVAESMELISQIPGKLIHKPREASPLVKSAILKRKVGRPKKSQTVVKKMPVVNKVNTALVYIPRPNNSSIEFKIPSDISAAEINAIKTVLDRFVQ